MGTSLRKGFWSYYIDKENQQKFNSGISECIFKNVSSSIKNVSSSISH